MKNYVLIFISLLLLSSCVTQRRCLQKFPPVVSSDTVYYETTRDSIVYRDTTIIITLAGQTVIDSIFIKPGIVQTSPVILETSLARAEAYYKTPKVYLKLVQKDTTLNIRLDSALKEAYYWKTSFMNITNQSIQKEKYIPNFYKVCTWLLIGIVFSILAYIIIKIVI